MWDIFDEMERMHKEMEKYFNRSLRGYDMPMLEGKKGEVKPYRNPITSLSEKGNNLVAEIELPGAKKEDIKVNVTENELEVSAEQKTEVEKKDKNNYSYESSTRSFYRRIPLAVEIDSKKAEAEYKDGVLKVTIPKLKVIEQKKQTLKIK